MFKEVYDAVKRIPRGKVATYGLIAALIGKPRAARQVGWALHVNPEPGVIPCHRVVDRNGRLSPAFAFGGKNMQAKLLEAEGVEVADGRIVKTHAPAMLEAAFRMDAPYGNSVSQGTIELSKQMKDDYNSAIGKYCKAVYEITAASMIQAKAQMAVSFHSGGKLLLPGNTCRFKTKGQDLFYGYIRNVVHHVSTNGGNSTTVAMSYVRPDASFKMKGQEAIKAGAPNAAYE